MLVWELRLQLTGGDVPMNAHSDILAGANSMRAFVLAALIFFAFPSLSSAVISVDLPGQCSDRNSLQGVAFDARLIAVKLYYEGVVRTLADKKKQACIEAHVLMDETFAVINKTREIVESKCLPIDIAAGIAMGDMCP